MDLTTNFMPIFVKLKYYKEYDGFIIKAHYSYIWNEIEEYWLINTTRSIEEEYCNEEDLLFFSYFNYGYYNNMYEEDDI